MSSVTAVTGASGHVGSNLCLALLAEGHRVRAIDLREPVEAVRHGAEWVRADIRDAAEIGPAIEGCELVYHLASVISVVGGLGGLVRSVNVDGARTLAEAAHDRGVRRLVHCSSVHAFDLAALTGQTVDETSPRSTRPGLPVYDRSKAAGEAEIRRVVERGLDAVIINPSGVVGPLDSTPSRMGAVLRAMWRGHLPALTVGGFDWVDVRDVVAALRSAAARGRTGESYLIGGHRLSIAALARAAAAASGSPVVAHVAPRWLLTLIGPGADLATKLTGTPLSPTREVMHALDSFPVIDISKARRELGHQPRDIHETLRDLHAQFIGAGGLSEKARS